MGDIKYAWIKAKQVITEHGDSQVVGIMSNLISMLLKANWEPTAFNSWNHNGLVWQLTGAKTPPDQVANAIIQSYASLELTRADSHYLGKGMKDGVHFRSTLSLLRSFPSSMFASKSLLENILSSSNWTADRIHSINPEYSNLCPRCNQHVETPLHCYWTCPANCLIDDPAITKSQHLVDKAIAGQHAEPCLWFRGILPINYIDIPDAFLPSDTYTVEWVRPNELSTNVTSGTYYGDASGGQFSEYPEIRRIGCSFVAIHPLSMELLLAAHFPLPGAMQTVPRGELFTLVELVRHAEINASLHYITDNKWVHDTFNRGSEHTKICNNSDLWHALFCELSAKNIRLKVTWMPSHLKDGKKVWPEHVSKTDVQGNSFADHFAGVSSALVSVPSSIYGPIIDNYKLPKLIQARIICIIQNLPARQRKQTILAAKELKPNLEQLVNNSKHIIIPNDGRYTCKICLSSFSHSDPELKTWLRSACTGSSFTTLSHDRPNPINEKFIHVGNQYIHVTHKLCNYKGFVYCGKCGYRKGSNQVRNLAKPCAPPGSFGAATLKAIQQGRLPPRLHSWPVEAAAGFPASDSELELY